MRKLILEATLHGKFFYDSDRAFFDEFKPCK